MDELLKNLTCWSCEQVGSWIWLNYKTKPSDEERQLLKSSGFKWSRKHAKWYMGGTGRRKGSKKSYGQIVATYGMRWLGGKKDNSKPHSHPVAVPF